MLAFLNCKKCESHFGREPRNENKQIICLNKQKHAKLIHSRLYKAFKGTVVNWTLPSLPGECRVTWNYAVQSVNV